MPPYPLPMPPWERDDEESERVMVDGRPMLRGRPVQALRVGDVYDSRSGELIGSYPLERLERLARVMNARGEKRRVPIDWNHATFDGGPPEGSAPLGFVEPGSAAMRDNGLWVRPVWSERGERVIRDAASLYLSVEFAVAYDGGFAPAFDAETGKRLGDEEIVAIALTPVPRVHGMQAVALSDAAAAAQQSPGAGQEAETMSDATVAPANGAEKARLAMETMTPENELEMLRKHRDELRLTRDALRVRCAELEQELGALRGELGTAREQAAMSETHLAETRAKAGGEVAQLAEQVAAHKAEATKLAERLAAVEEARYSEQREVAIGDLVRSGAILGSRIDYMRRLYDAEHKDGRPGLFSELAAFARANPAVRLGEAGHGAVIDAMEPREAEAAALKTRAAAIAAERGLHLYDAMKLAQKEGLQ